MSPLFPLHKAILADALPPLLARLLSRQITHIHFSKLCLYALSFLFCSHLIEQELIFTKNMNSKSIIGGVKLKIKELKGNYSAIYSLGDLCLAGLQLRKNNLRPFAGPLDWMSSESLPNVTRLIKNRFEGYMDQSNLVPAGYSTGVDSSEQYLCLTDTAYQIVSSHDFKASQNTFTNLIMYPHVRAKFDRRISRFLDNLAHSNKLLFIRTEGDLEEVIELESVLSEMVKKDFTILLINHTNTTTLVEKNWPVRNVCAIELPNYEKWLGNDALWKYIFTGISVDTV